MAKSSFAPYHHCPRCGLTSVNPQHVCDPERLVAPEVAAPPIVTRSTNRITMSKPTDSFGHVQADHLSSALTSLLRRSVAVRPNNTNTYQVRQRCPACHADVDKTVVGEADYVATFAAVGAAARKAYLMHACPPVETSLHGLTWDELEELHATLERDVNRIGERQRDIEQLRKERW